MLRIVPHSRDREVEECHEGLPEGRLKFGARCGGGERGGEPTDVCCVRKGAQREGLVWPLTLICVANAERGGDDARSDSSSIVRATFSIGGPSSSTGMN